MILFQVLPLSSVPPVVTNVLHINVKTFLKFATCWLEGCMQVIIRQNKYVTSSRFVTSYTLKGILNSNIVQTHGQRSRTFLSLLPWVNVLTFHLYVKYVIEGSRYRAHYLDLSFCFTKKCLSHPRSQIESKSVLGTLPRLCDGVHTVLTLECFDYKIFLSQY